MQIYSYLWNSVETFLRLAFLVMQEVTLSFGKEDITSAQTGLAEAVVPHQHFSIFRVYFSYSHNNYKYPQCPTEDLLLLPGSCPADC